MRGLRLHLGLQLSYRLRSPARVLLTGSAPRPRLADHVGSAAQAWALGQAVPFGAVLAGWHDRAMAKIFEEIDEKLADWIRQQHIFFVGTAPIGADGNVNVSPKGMGGTFAILGPRTVAYLDYTGSGAETIAHLRENARIVLMLLRVRRAAQDRPTARTRSRSSAG